MAINFGLAQPQGNGYLDTLQAFALGRESRMQQQKQAGRQRASEQLGAGDTTGARTTAIETGNYDMATSIGQLSDDQRKQALDQADVMGATAYSLRQKPADQRLAAFRAAVPALRARGFSMEELEAAARDLSDNALDGYVGAASSVKEQIGLLTAQTQANKPIIAGPGTDVLDPRTGQVLHSTPFAPRPVTVGDGQTVIEYQPGGGDPASAAPGASAPGGLPTGQDIEMAALDFVPGTIVSGRGRTPERNREVGGVPGSYHLTDQARDLQPPPGVPMARFHAELKQQFGPGFDVINEGNHVHVEPSRQAAGGSRIIARGDPKPRYTVLTPQENAELGLDPNIKYQRSPDGQVTAIGGQDRSQGQLTKQQAGLARTKLTSLQAIDNQLRRVEAAMAAAEKDGNTGWFAGRLPGAINAASDKFDTAVAGLAPLIRQLTRVPGEGAMSDYESRLSEATLPNRTQTPEGRREALAQMRDLIRETRLGYAEMLGGSAPSAPAAPRQPKAGDVEGGYRFKGGNPADPNRWEKVR
ncbi:D-Ala-D-Ala carboxypeptidase family metallohydrolase [Rhizorhabdus histidinilytica]|uniref:Peptidase M15 n=1 Tax=Rhizorhabdus histidinilytica TaxID=439228 RepID=A0A1T5CGG5_9SPHN|nr:D-Ala-D-Ala carboxypeptidase family metallohydrolase [Rhizorhabdus histidinilytica]SKB58568.1 Peptidase M15 [Rhizorhabdus histidinilytica]